MAFTVLGILFIMLFGVEIAYQEFFPTQDPELDGHPVRINNSEIIPVVSFITFFKINEITVQNFCIVIVVPDRIAGPFKSRGIS